MFGICLRYCKCKDDAEDLLHDGFLKVFDKVIDYQFINEKKFTNWLKRIFINMAIDRLKKSKKNLTEDVDDVEIEGDYFIYPEENQFSLNELVQLINELPIGYKVVFNMYCIENYSHKEISEHLGISISTSTSQLTRAKKMLQEKLISKEVYYER